MVKEIPEGKDLDIQNIEHKYDILDIEIKHLRKDIPPQFSERLYAIEKGNEYLQKFVIQDLPKINELEKQIGILNETVNGRMKERLTFLTIIIALLGIIVTIIGYFFIKGGN